MNNNHIEKEIIDYVKRKNTSYALMMTSTWGSGKTYYVNKRLRNLVNEEGLTFSYITLFNSNDFKDVLKEIFYNSMSEKKVIKRVSKYSTKGKKQLVRSILTSIFSTFKANLNIVIDEIPYKHMIDFENKLIILDDFERSKMDVRDLFGYISDLAENFNAKILVVCNEDEIYGNESRKNKLQKYDLFLTHEKKLIEFEEKKNKDVFYYLDKKKDSKSQSTYNIVDLDYATATYFDLHEDYILYKEKVIQKTLEYSNDMNIDFDSVLMSQEYSLDKHEFLTDYKEEIVKAFKNNISSNYRTLIFVFDCVYELLGNIVIDGFDEIEYILEVVKLYVHQICKLSIESREQKSDINLYLNESKSQYMNLNNENHKMNKLLVSYILNSRSNKELFVNSIQSHYNFKITQLELELYKYNNLFLSDQVEEYQIVITKMLNNLKNYNIDFGLYHNILGRIFNYDKRIDNFDNFNKCLEIMKFKLGKTMEIPEYSDFNSFDSNSPYLRENLKSLDNLFNETRDRVISKRIQNSLSQDDWAQVLRSYYVNDKMNRYLTDKKYLVYYDIKELAKVIMKASTQSIYVFREVLNGVYKSSNIGEFLSNDYSKLVELKDAIDYERENKGNINNTQQFDFLIADLESYIAKIEPYVKSGN